MVSNLRNTGYPFIKSRSGLLNPISDILDNAKSKLLVLLNTYKGQRILSNNCQFGIDLNKLVFQNIKYQDYESKITQNIKQQVNKWIPQIKDIKIKIEQNQDEYELIIKFEFSVDLNEYTTVSMEIEMDE